MNTPKSTIEVLEFIRADIDDRIGFANSRNYLIDARVELARMRENIDAVIDGLRNIQQTDTASHGEASYFPNPAFDAFRKE